MLEVETLTCGQCPPDFALRSISRIVFLRESGSLRETSTGCTQRKNPGEHNIILPIEE